MLIIKSQPEGRAAGDNIPGTCIPGTKEDMKQRRSKTRRATYRRQHKPNYIELMLLATPLTQTGVPSALQPAL